MWFPKLTEKDIIPTAENARNLSKEVQNEEKEAIKKLWYIRTKKDAQKSLIFRMILLATLKGENHILIRKFGYENLDSDLLQELKDKGYIVCGERILQQYYYNHIEDNKKLYISWGEENQSSRKTSFIVNSLGSRNEDIKIDSVVLYPAKDLGKISVDSKIYYKTVFQKEKEAKEKARKQENWIKL